jgi:hypothetical protein
VLSLGVNCTRYMLYENCTLPTSLSKFSVNVLLEDFDFPHGLDNHFLIYSLSLFTNMKDCIPKG